MLRDSWSVYSVCARCLSWETGQRPPVADVLASLMQLVPPSVPHSQLLEKQSHFTHSDRSIKSVVVFVCSFQFFLSICSLGVIFLSVSDSTDVGVGVANDTEVMAQETRDAQLAEQLQMKENSYMTPRYTLVV